MRDKSKQLLVINTGKKKSEQTGMPSQSGTTHIIGGGGLSVNMSDYLLKSIWDNVFEIRTDSQGTEYIFGKLPMVIQYGITMYSGDGVDIPSLASGLPFDGRTIWYNPDTQQIEVIGGTGGGSGEGVSNFWDLSGIPSWITITKPKYTYSEIEGTPDLTKYALATQIPSLSGYATESWVNQQNYAIKATTLSGYGITDAYTKTNVDDLLKAYVTLGGTQTITGEKNFTGGLKVNGSPIYYDTEKKYWKLEGDLLVTGGVTMYGSDSSFTPSTIMDALLYDDATLGINSNGQLYVKGGTSSGGLDITALQNYLTQNSYLNVTSGDNRYLKLSGGKLSGNIVLQGGYLNFTNSSGSFLGAYNVNDSGEALYLKGSTWNTILHSGNYSQYALPLSGGTLDGVLTLRAPSSSYDSWIEFSNKSNSVVHKLGVRRPESSYGLQYYNGSEYYKIWHSGNDGSGSELDADLLDGQEETTFAKWKSGIASSGEYRHIGYAYGSNGWITSGAAMAFGADKDYFMQIQGGGSKNKDVLLYARYIYEGIYSDWKTIAFTDSNVASATKLQTARTIWGQSFDGTGNVSGNLTLENNYEIVTKNTSGSISSTLYRTKSNNLSIGEGIANESNDTYISGNNLFLRYGTGLTNGISLISSGNVGVGTTSPTSLLHVNGDGRITNIHFRGAFINLNRDGATSAIYDSTKTALEIEATSGVSILRTYNVTRQASIALHTNGNIGIGTISPSEKLHVEGGVRVNGQIIGATSIVSNTTNGFFVGNRNDGLGVTDGGLLLYTYGKTPISFYASGERMRIDASSGNVGIGTPNPQDKLDVAGNIMTNGGLLFTRVGTGTYNKFTISSNTTYGVEIEAPRATDSSTGTALPIFIGWRGGALGIKITSGGNLLANGGITMYSDKRKKTILNHVELSLKQIAEAPLIEHYYNSDDKKTTHVGSIAQYWASMNDWFCKLDSEGYYTMEIQNAALASAISIARELDRYETKTDKAIKKLKKRICELEEEVERLKSA